MTNNPDDLVDAHRALHARFEDALYAVLEALVQLDVDGAAAKLDAFERATAAHMAWEDAAVMPAYSALAPKDGPGRADHIAGDHVILARNTQSAKDAIAQLSSSSSSSSLREVLAMLPAVYRVLGVLEHHTAREQNNVYPALARTWSRDDVNGAIAALRSQAQTA